MIEGNGNLALQEGIERLHFRVINQEHFFELFDHQGKRLYFGVDCQRAAERSLMKILFSLNFLEKQPRIENSLSGAVLAKFYRFPLPAKARWTIR